MATVGLWLESLWIGAVYHYPWPTSIWPEALAMAVPVAILVGGCGAMFGHGAVRPASCRAGRSASASSSLTVLAIGGATANGLRYDVPESATATITLTDAPGRRAVSGMVTADVQLTPANLVSDDPNWVSILAWQGHLENQRGQFVDQSGEGRPRPLPHHRTRPVWGTWKTLLRVHDGKTLTAVPIYLAGDPGIGAKEVPAEASMTRPFVARDHHPAARAQPGHPRSRCGRSAAWSCWSAR